MCMETELISVIRNENNENNNDKKKPLQENHQK